MSSVNNMAAANWSMASGPVRPMGLMQQPQPMMSSPMISSPMMMSNSSFSQPLLGHQQQNQATKKLTAAEMQDLLS